MAGAGSVRAGDPRRAGPPASGAWRFAVLIVLGLYFLVPITASVLFTVRDRGSGGVTLRHYAEIPGAEGFADGVHPVAASWPALTVVLVLLLMVPTVVLVELRLPRLRTTVELLTLMPLVLPPIALVVGVRSVLSWAPDYFLNTPLAEAFFALQEPSLPWILVLVYVVLALPFVYRALDAGVRGADLRTLTEAARNLGASWPRVLRLRRPAGAAHLGAQRRVPHLRAGAGGVHDRRDPRLRDLPDVDRADLRVEPQLSVAVSVLSLLVTWVLLLLISALDRRRGTKESS